MSLLIHGSPNGPARTKVARPGDFRLEFHALVFQNGQIITFVEIIHHIIDLKVTLES